MLTAIVSLVLTAATFAGMVLLLFSDRLSTADGLFFTIILGSISAIFALNSLQALLSRHRQRVKAQPGRPAPASRPGVVNPDKPGGTGQTPASGRALANAEPAARSESAGPAAVEAKAPARTPALSRNV
jgi:hypothetical protein